jgi:hypothetical protein
MSFDTWCLCHSFDLRRRLDSGHQDFLRRLFAADARSAHEAMVARYVSELGPGIIRDIMEGRFEA